MSRCVKWIFLLLLAAILPACQLDAKKPLFSLVGQQAETATPTLTRTSTATPTATISPTWTASPALTRTPSPTMTPRPTERLALAQNIYNNGNYQAAAAQFEALLSDPGTSPDNQRIALHWRGRSELNAGDTSAAIATFKQFLQRYPSDELTRAAQFNLGLAYEKNGQFDTAATAYQGAVISNDPINVYIYERIGDVAVQAQDYASAVKAYQAGIAEIEETSFQTHLREEIAAVEILRDNPLAALDQYDAILRAAKMDNYRAKILRLAAEAHLAANDPNAAHERYFEAINRYPKAYDSYLGLVELVNADVPVDEFQRGLVDYYAGAYQAAIAAFDRYLNPPLPPPITVTTIITPATLPAEAVTQDSAITSTTVITAEEAMPHNASLTSLPIEPTPPPHAADAIWFTALSWQALGQNNSAIRFFQQLIDEYPTDSNWGKAHLEIGQSRARQDNITSAKVTYRDFAAEYPTHALAPEALWRAARLELDGDLLEEAQASLRELRDTYPNSDFADDALYWAGQAAFLTDDFESAADHWSVLAESYPNSELSSFGGYWQVKALLALGKPEQAQAVLVKVASRSNEYYGLRARDLLAGVQPHSVPLVLPTPPELAKEHAEAEAWVESWLNLTGSEEPSALKPQVRDDPAFQRGSALLALGLRDEALVEFETVKDNWWNDALAMYQLALYFAEHGLGRLSIVSVARLIFLSPADSSEEAPIFIQRLYYPTFFADVIFEEAAALNVDPALLLAIMRQESLFERSAESIAGARGLMQVMPATGEYVAERRNYVDFSPDQLWHPYISIKVGAWYIDQQLDIFEDNQFAALAAYNAGPGNVLEWIKRSDDLDRFVESIPFRESRLYIRTIYVNLAAYRRIYGAN